MTNPHDKIVTDMQKLTSTAFSITSALDVARNRHSQ